MTDNQQERIDKVVLDLRRLSRELGKKNITISDCRNSSNEYAITWVRNNCKMNFNDLKKLAGLPVNGKGASSYGRRGVHTVVQKIGEKRECNKCGKMFQRTNLNRAICPKCSSVNAQHTEGGGPFFNGAEHFY